MAGRKKKTSIVDLESETPETPETSIVDLEPETKPTEVPVDEVPVDEVPVDEVPVRDLPGFEKGSRLDPQNPHDVKYARQLLRRLRSRS